VDDHGRQRRHFDSHQITESPMKLRLLILLAAAALAAAPAAGQTVKSLGYNTTNGNIVAATNVTFTNSVGFATNARAATRTNLGGTTVGNAVFTATNAAAAATAVGLGANNEVSFLTLNARMNAGESNSIVFNSPIAFDDVADEDIVAKTRTNLGLGATNNVTFSNVTASGTLTATGNATLNGSDNLMPNATTASSGASLMTRELTDDNPLWALGSVRPMGAYAFGNSGSPATAVEAVTRGGAFLATGANTNGYGRASLYQGINDAPLLSGQGIRFTQSITASAILSTVPRTNGVVRLIVGGNGGVPAAADADALAVRGFGVEFAVDPSGFKMRLFAHNGTSYTNSAYSAGIANSSAPPQHVIISSQTNGVISLYHSIGVVKSPPRPSTTPLLTLSGGPTSGFGGGYVDLVTVTASNTAATPIPATAVFYSGMIEVKD
jgi:hypothetical protein